MCEVCTSSFQSHADAAGEQLPLSQRGSCRVRRSEAARLQERRGGRVHEIIPKDLADCEKVEPWLEDSPDKLETESYSRKLLVLYLLFFKRLGCPQVRHRPLLSAVRRVEGKCKSLSMQLKRSPFLHLVQFLPDWGELDMHSSCYDQEPLSSSCLFLQLDCGSMPVSHALQHPVHPETFTALSL